MVIYYGNSIEEILTKNLKKGGDEPIIGVGVDVITYPPNSNRPFFYKSNIKYLCKDDLEKFVHISDIEDNKVFERYVVATRANVNMAIDTLKEDLQNSKLIEVLEADWYIKKLINADIVQEVQGFIFDPRERSKH